MAVSISIASSTMAMTVRGTLLDHGPGEPQHAPAVQDKEVLPPAVALEYLGAGVIQASVDLDRELELAKDQRRRSTSSQPGQLVGSRAIR